MTSKGNVLDEVPATLVEEFSERLVARRGVRFERIVSRGQSSPPGFWYDQDQHEFVFVVQGHAMLELERGEKVQLGPGDWLQIDAHVRHRVHATAPDALTVWLVAFFDV